MGWRECLVNWSVSWRCKPSHSLRIMSGLKTNLIFLLATLPTSYLIKKKNFNIVKTFHRLCRETFMKVYVVEKTTEAKIRLKNRVLKLRVWGRIDGVKYS